jgi:hypothetical protein
LILMLSFEMHEAWGIQSNYSWFILFPCKVIMLCAMLKEFRQELATASYMENV